MRDQPTNVENSPNGESGTRTASQRSPTPRSEPRSAGFTAVNGDRHSISSFRPLDTSRPSMTSPNIDSPHDTIVVSTRFNPHSWRPGTSDQLEQRSESRLQDDSSIKRKRSSEAGDGDKELNSVNAGRPSSKSRHLPLGVDSAVDITSPDAPVGNRLPDPRASERELSSVDQGSHPLKVRPETEKRLAESVLRFKQDRQVYGLQSQQVRPVAGEQASNPQASNDQQEVQNQDEDQTQAENSDSRKRKRSFTHRTKSGCHTCRRRKKKCDERKPLCNNCEKGGFTCDGYGAKPPGGRNSTQSRTVVPLQPSSKAGYDGQVHAPASRWPPHSHGQDYSHWGRIPPLQEQDHLRKLQDVDTRQHGGADLASARPWSSNEHRPRPLPPYYSDRPPPAEPLSMPPRPPSHAHSHEPQTPLSLPPPPPLPQIDAWGQLPGVGPLLPPTGTLTMIGSNHSGSSSASYGRHFYGGPSSSEKDKMLRGQPYLHFTDPTLIQERNTCLRAVYQYNKSGDPDMPGYSSHQRAKLFTQILEPPKRDHKDSREHWGPIGDIADFTTVETPFKCDYGYHIHIGKECGIMAGCYMQDGGGIFVGDRCIIGSNVQLLTMTATVDSNLRKGSQGKVRSGSIWICDDVFIGAGSIVLPYVTIGKGSVVGAGSVVTKDVRENTVVVGNPAKLVRHIDALTGDKHYDYEAQKQEVQALERMESFANAGFRDRSPRLI